MPKVDRAKIQIIFENDDLVVINKPPLVDSQNSKEGRDSVVDWLNHHYGFAGLVHRLDMGTSGLMVCAKNENAAAKLTKLLQDGKIERIYQAIVIGRTLADTGEFRDPLDDKEACSRYRVLKRFPNACLVEVELETGRKHQIRRHFSIAGHPIIGDRLYGKKGSQLLFDRPALHAYKLKIDGKEYEARLPQDMQDILKRWQT